MSLKWTGMEPVRTGELFGRAIQMQTSEGSVVRVVVTDDFLENMKSPPSSDDDRLREYMADIEGIASEKSEKGDVRLDGSVLVASNDAIRIRGE